MRALFPRGVAPRTALERQMVKLWQQVLAKKAIGVTDDFFELGGYSLHACLLMTQIKREFGWEIPLDRWLRRPTVEGTLAIRRAMAEGSSTGRFLAFNASGSQSPLVLFPGLCGSPASFRGLPDRMGRDQPVYLAQSLDFEAPDELLVPSLEHMADAYEAELMQLSPSRRLILGGYSFGMLLVLELAYRMQRSGYSVPLLVSLDSGAPDYPKFLPTKGRILAHLREISLGDRRRYIADRLSNTQRRILRSLGREYLLMPHMRSASPEMRQITKRLFDLTICAVDRYRPQFTVHSDLLYFRAQAPERHIGIEADDPQSGWGSQISGHIEVVSIPGEHGTILDPRNHAIIVKEYRRCINELVLTSLDDIPEVAS